MYHHPQQQSLQSDVCEVPGGSPPSGSHGLQKGQTEITLLWGKCQAAPISAVDRPCQAHSNTERAGESMHTSGAASNVSKSWSSTRAGGLVLLEDSFDTARCEVYQEVLGKFWKAKAKITESNWTESPGPRVERGLTAQHWFHLESSLSAGLPGSAVLSLALITHYCSIWL